MRVERAEHELFDHSLMEAMLADGGEFVYEVRGSRMIVFAPQLPVDGLPRSMDAESA